MQSAGQFYIGTSGIVVPVTQAAYPDSFKGRSRLSYYASLMNSLEVNSTFYKDPLPATVENWAGEVGEDFRFTFKLPKKISHAKELQFNNEDVESFMSLVNNIGEKKGCLLVQLPPSSSVRSVQELDRLLEKLRSNIWIEGWDIAVEFRNTSWYTDEVSNLLKHWQACRVIHDHPKSAPALISGQDFFYLRFHGEAGRYSGSYELNVLHQYAMSIKDWLSEGKRGYCYFNNTMGAAFQNANSLAELIDH